MADKAQGFEFLALHLVIRNKERGSPSAPTGPGHRAEFETKRKPVGQGLVEIERPIAAP